MPEIYLEPVQQMSPGARLVRGHQLSKAMEVADVAIENPAMLRAYGGTLRAARNLRHVGDTGGLPMPEASLIMSRRRHLGSQVVGLVVARQTMPTPDKLHASFMRGTLLPAAIQLEVAHRIVDATYEEAIEIGTVALGDSVKRIREDSLRGSWPIWTLALREDTARETALTTAGFLATGEPARYQDASGSEVSRQLWVSRPS